MTSGARYGYRVGVRERDGSWRWVEGRVWERERMRLGSEGLSRIPEMPARAGYTGTTERALGRITDRSPGGRSGPDRFSEGVKRELVVAELKRPEKDSGAAAPIEDGRKAPITPPDQLRRKHKGLLRKAGDIDLFSFPNPVAIFKEFRREREIMKEMLRSLSELLGVKEFRGRLLATKLENAMKLSVHRTGEIWSEINQIRDPDQRQYNAYNFLFYGRSESVTALRGALHRKFRSVLGSDRINQIADAALELGNSESRRVLSKLGTEYQWMPAVIRYVANNERSRSAHMESGTRNLEGLVPQVTLPGGSVINMVASPLIIGSDSSPSGSRIVIKAHGLGGRHAMIAEERGEYFLYTLDLDSEAYPVHVARAERRFTAPEAGGEGLKLQDGDEIKIGTAVLKFHIPIGIDSTIPTPAGPDVRSALARPDSRRTGILGGAARIAPEIASIRSSEERERIARLVVDLNAKTRSVEEFFRRLRAHYGESIEAVSVADLRSEVDSTSPLEWKRNLLSLCLTHPWLGRVLISLYGNIAGSKGIREGVGVKDMPPILRHGMTGVSLRQYEWVGLRIRNSMSTLIEDQSQNANLTVRWHGGNGFEVIPINTQGGEIKIFVSGRDTQRRTAIDNGGSSLEIKAGDAIVIERNIGERRKDVRLVLLPPPETVFDMARYHALMRSMEDARTAPRGRR